MSRRGCWLVGLLVALLVAGLGSYYASAHPDGLEHVAEQSGFGHTAEESATADSPFADYSTEGVEDDRVSGGIAGLVGTLGVLLLAGGLFRLLRRRAPDRQEPSAAAAAADPADSRR